MTRRAILGLGLCAAGCSAPSPAPPPAPTVAVSVTPAVRGTAPDLVTAFGTAAPSGLGSRTLSVAQAGQVGAIAVLPGTAVHTGQPLVRFTTAPGALSGFQQATTALATAQRARATTAQLLGLQLATRDQLAQADKAVADATAALAALRRDGAGDASPTLVAPFDGIVAAVTAAPGDRPQPGAPLITIARNDSIVVTAGIDPAMRDRVRIGQRVRLTAVGGGPVRPGRVVRASRIINPRTRLIDIEIGTPAGTVLPGEALAVGIVVGEVAGWIVPHRAVVTAGGDAHILQVAAGKAVAVPVVVVRTDATSDVVTGGLDTRRPVIVDGAYQAQPGDAVRTAAR